MIIILINWIIWATTTKAIEKALDYSDRIIDRQVEVREIEYSFLLSNISKVVEINKNNNMEVAA